MNERDVQRWIWQAKHKSMVVMVPNYAPLRWSECDVFAVTQAGYFYEYEIKLTVSDFRADAQKLVGAYPKHKRLREGDLRGPSVFFFVVPDGLVSPREVPAWAGLIYVSRRCSEQGWFGVEKVPPRRHQRKVPDAVVRAARGVCYHRYWDERLKLDRRMAGGAA